MRQSGIILLASFLFLISLPKLSVQDAEAIFTQATKNLVSGDIEMDMEVKTTDSKGRVKEKGFKVLVANFGDVEKMKVSWQKPERAKGTTIIITTTPNEIGVIEVYTPSNGKVRKLKATEENMKLVGSEFSMINMKMGDPKELLFTYLKSEVLNGKDCHIIDVKSKSKDATDLSKGRLWIETQSYKIVQIKVYDDKGKHITLVELSNFKPIAGIANKIQPMKMVSRDINKNKITSINILKISKPIGVSEADFVFPQRGNL